MADITWVLQGNLQKDIFSHLPANTITIIICCGQHGRIPNKLNPNNIGTKRIQYFLVEKLPSVNMTREFILTYSTHSTTSYMPPTVLSHGIKTGINKCFIFMLPYTRICFNKRLLVNPLAPNIRYTHHIVWNSKCQMSGIEGGH
jgi:hypothetical protein